MDEKIAGGEKLRQLIKAGQKTATQSQVDVEVQNPDGSIDSYQLTGIANLAEAPDLIPPHYALQDFSQVIGKRIFSQRKGDIIRDQQMLNSYKQQDAPIAPFDERQIAKCPNPKCGCVFAWDNGSTRET